MARQIDEPPDRSGGSSSFLRQISVPDPLRRVFSLRACAERVDAAVLSGLGRYRDGRAAELWRRGGGPFGFGHFGENVLIDLNLGVAFEACPRARDVVFKDLITTRRERGAR